MSNTNKLAEIKSAAEQAVREPAWPFSLKAFQIKATPAAVLGLLASNEQLVAALRQAESMIDTLALASLDRVDSVNDPRRSAITAALAAAEA